MNHLEINSRCIYCDDCRLICPENAVFIQKKSFYIDPWLCTLCGICIEVCPSDCIKPKQVSQED